MRCAVLIVALFLSAPALGEFDGRHPPPEWMLRGYEAAIFDPAAVAAVVKEIYPFGDLATFVPASKAGDLVDKLLPLLGDPDRDVRSAAAQALGQITPEDGADAMVDKLLPLLSYQNSYAAFATREA
jgi:hypothetical protein